MRKSNLEIEFEELSELFGCKIDTVRKIYEELITKECVKSGDFDQMLDCLHCVLLEKTIKNCIRKKYNSSYSSSNDYVINSSLVEVYGDEALEDLSDEYLYFSTYCEDFNDGKDNYIPCL